MEPYLICGLGNPGERYRGTRHNIGFAVLDAVAGKYRGRWRDRGGNRDACAITVSGEDVLLVKPMTYMNLSGVAVAEAAREAGTSNDRMVVVCDDIALPLGRIRLRKSGSDGGHNGLKSVAAELGTFGFARLRMGVGPVPETIDASDFVLDRFTDDEADTAARMVREAVACLVLWVEGGIERAMNRFNARPEDPESV